MEVFNRCLSSWLFLGGLPLLGGSVLGSRMDWKQNHMHTFNNASLDSLSVLHSEVAVAKRLVFCVEVGGIMR